MKITTWNVNGLRAVLNKGGWDWVKEYSPDTICLQEIKAMPEQLTEEQHALFEGYTPFWNPAERKGYSGTATLMKKESASSTGLGVEKFDDEGRTTRTQFDDFTLFNIYFPNGKRDHSRVPFKLDFYARLLEICEEMKENGEKVIICGDINTAHEEIDLKNHKTNHKTTGFLPEERAWITKFIEHGYVDAFRLLYPEREEYSWWSFRSNARANNVGWRLDYFLISEDLMPQVEDVVIHTDVMGSDHCPVTLVLN